MTHSKYNAKAGWYDENFRRCASKPDGGKWYFRSRLELKCALHLELLKKAKHITRWEYQGETLRFAGRKYIPDFVVSTKTGTYYVEVKGWLDQRSINNVAGFTKAFPEKELQIFTAKGTMTAGDWLVMARRTLRERRGAIIYGSRHPDIPM